MNCDVIEDADVAQRYLLGGLSEQERDAYEAHYFVCAACFERLETLQAIRKNSLAQNRSRRSRLVFAGIAAAAILVAFLGALPRFRRGEAHVSVGQTTTVPREESLRLLARIDPPQYTPSNLRGSGNADRLFRTAMDSYIRANYAAAAQGLEDALRENPEAAGPRFYLGVCDLLLGKIDAASGELQRTADLGETPYLEPARFFLAKALLARQDLPGAEQALRLTMELAGDREQEARRLLEQVQALQKQK